MAPITRFIRAHLRQSIIAGSVMLALALGGAAFAVSNSGSGSASPPPAAAPAPTASVAPPARPRALRGVLTAIAPRSWTVRTAKGQTMTVTVNTQTQFGTRKVPSTSSAFAVGDRIVVSGPQTATTAVATRIAKAPVAPVGSTTSTSTTVPATPSAG